MNRNLRTDEELEDDKPLGLTPGMDVRLSRLIEELYDDEHDRRYIYTHYNGSFMWDLLPFNINPNIWLRYYVLVEIFANLFPDCTMCVHGRITLPIAVTETSRTIVYTLFLDNTPFAIYDLIRLHRFTLSFIHIEGQTDIGLTIFPYYLIRVDRGCSQRIES